jgi:hypothetical protein
MTAAASAAGGPSISFDKETHDYGRVRYGETVSEEFVFTNTGDQTLHIDKLEASCGCTKAIKGNTDVAPNGKSKVIAAFDTVGLRAGKKRQTVSVYSNDPNKPVVQLTLLVDVIREVNVSPPNLVMKLPSFVETVSLPVKITNSSDKPVVVQIRPQKESTPSPAEAKRIVAPPRSAVPFKFVMNLKNEPGRSFWAGRMMLETDHPTEKEIEVPYMIKLEHAGDTTAPMPHPNGEQ